MTEEQRLLDENRKLKKQVRDHRKAIRLAFDAEWMVTNDWTTGDEREDMWKAVKKLTGMRNLSE